jgi:hypothetical protein
MAYRSEIERALDELISDEAGMKFQGLATILARQKWPQLGATERKWDQGLDAHASGTLDADGKGIALACSLTATLKKIESDATEVKQHYPDVKVLIFSTAVKVTEHTAAPWKEAVLKQFGFELIIESREQLIAQLREPANAEICREQLGIAPQMAADLEPALKRSQDAAQELAENWDRDYRKPGRPVISLNAVKLDEQGKPIEALTTGSLGASLEEGQRLILEGPAGSGKTTTLVQFAQRVLATGGLAFLVDLPGWIRSGKDILSFIAGQPQFLSHDVDPNLLSKLRPEQPLVFLLNGWNEVSVAGVEAANVAIRELERNFPAAVMIVATRIHRLMPPLRGAVRVELKPLGRAQRNEYLRLVLGSSAHELQVKLDASRVLDSVTRTPLILAEVADLYGSGKEIPPTKMGVLRAVMDAMEQSTDHRANLQQAPLRGHAAEYLRDLSMKMTERGETNLGEVDARTIVNSVSSRLQSAGQIVSSPDPGEILDELSKHHVLVQVRADEVSFRFQHQQFQEVFAAGGLKARLAEMATRKDPTDDRKFLVSYVNEPRWGESLRMLAQDIGASTGDKVTIDMGAKVVRMALEVDPIFAAELARWCGPLVWNEVRNEVELRLRAWYAETDPNHKRCALAAMLETGSDDFKDIVVPLLTAHNDQNRLALYHGGAEFLPSSLGSDWSTMIRSWPDEARLDLILQLARDPWLSETVEQLALADPSPKIKRRVAQIFSWYGYTEKVEKLLGALDDGDFHLALESSHFADIPPSLGGRAIRVYEKAYEDATDPFERLRLLRALQTFGASQIVERTKAELEALDEKQLNVGNDGGTQWALEELQKSDPHWVSQWLAMKVLNGSARFGGWSAMVTTMPEAERNEIFARFGKEVLDPNEKQRVLSLLASTADARLAVQTFEIAGGVRRGLSEAPGRDLSKWNLFRQLEDLLKAIAPRILLEGLSDKLEEQPEATELAVLTEVLATFNPTTTDVRKTVSDDMRQKLHAYLTRAVEKAADPNGVSANVRAHLALLLAQAGSRQDIPNLRRLIAADTIRYREMQSARLRRDNSGDPVSYVYLYIGAVTTADPEHADEVLLELLTDPQYERVTAEALVRKAKKSEGPLTLENHRLDFTKIWVAREGKGADEFVEAHRSRYADAIREVIENLLKERDVATDKRLAEYRVKQLGSALAALDAERSAKLILEIMAFPGRHDGYTRVASLESLVVAGVRLKVEEMLNVIAPTIEELRNDVRNNNQSAGLLQRCLSLLAFVDPPADGIAKIREILSGIRFRPYDSISLVSALGASRCADAMDLLMELAGTDGSGVGTISEPWIKAVAQVGGQRSNQVLISFVDPDAAMFTKEFLPDHRNGGLLARLLAERAEADGDFKAKLFSLADGDLPQVKRLLLAKAFAHFQKEADLVAGLSVLRDDGSGVPYEILRSIEDRFLERRPYGAGGNSFTLAPRGSNAVRKRLFEMTQTDPVRKHSAFALLGQIEAWRLDHGRPTDEPRHPDVESNISWPPLLV